jgi:alkanesulfonate monooxygenase SsuD/methylene tetrahydromethanopterin reductase-like flavin-dependent oxidoreductase (luciferase family)
MRFSVWPNLQQPVDDVVAIARHAEATGWDGVWVADHFMGDGGGFGPVGTPTLEATAVLGALAVATERVRIGPLVLGSTYRHPAVVANWAATVDHLSGGRLVLGLGAGWQVNEHDQYGIELPDVGDRVGRFEEVCSVVRRLLTEERTTLEGRWFQLRDAVCEPKPVGPLPLLVGGKGDRMLGIAGRHADEWNMWALPEVHAERAAVLDRACEAAGRDPGDVRRSTQALVVLTDDEAAATRFVEAVAPRAAFAGTAERFAELVGAWAEVGVDEVIVPDFAMGSADRTRDALDAIIEVLRPVR